MIPTKLRRLPVGAVSPGLDVDDGGKRVRREKSVLVLADLPASQLRRLRERGAVLTHVAHVFEAVRVLADRDFDAAIIDFKARGGGSAFVKSIKAGVGSVNPLEALVVDEMLAVTGVNPESLDNLRAMLPVLERHARKRHQMTPFFLVMEGEQQFAIMVVPPEHSYLEDGKGISLPDAVMSLDVGKLLQRGPAIA